MAAGEMGSAKPLVFFVGLALGGCTTGAYEPSVGDLSSAARVIGPLVSGESVVLRKEYRQSYLNLEPAGSSLDLARFVCEPLGYTSAPLGSGSELTGFGDAAKDVATVPRQRGWIDLVGSLFRSYEMPPLRPVETLQNVRIDAYTECAADAAGVDQVDAYLIKKVGTTLVPAGRSIDDTVTSIIEIVEPAVLGALSTIDNQRRASALRKFFSDGERVARLKAHVGVLKDFFSVMDKYRRLRAMESVSKAAAAAGARDDTLVSLAATYDTVFAVQMHQAFVDIEQSIDAMVAVARGEDEVALIHSATAATFRTIRAIQGIRELTEDGPKKERLQRLIDQLTGKTPDDKGKDR